MNAMLSGMTRFNHKCTVDRETSSDEIDARKSSFDGISANELQDEQRDIQEDLAFGGEMTTQGTISRWDAQELGMTLLQSVMTKIRMQCKTMRMRSQMKHWH